MGLSPLNSNLKLVLFGNIPQSHPKKYKTKNDPVNKH